MAKLRLVPSSSQIRGARSVLRAVQNWVADPGHRAVWQLIVLIMLRGGLALALARAPSAPRSRREGRGLRGDRGLERADATAPEAGPGGAAVSVGRSAHLRRRERQAELERQRGKSLTEKSQKSFADPEARMMMTGDGSRQRCLVAAGRGCEKPTRWPKGRETLCMHRTLRLPWARARHGKRKTQGERPFAEIKAALGFRRFRRFSPRGVSKMSGGWDLVCAAFNLRRLAALMGATG